MTNYMFAVLATYLYGIYLIVLRTKISHRSIRFVKFLYLFLFALDILLLILDFPQDTWVLITDFIVLLPLIYMLYATYINEVHEVAKRLGLFGYKSYKKQTDNELAEMLLETVDFLANRKVGALITIERNNNLSAFISKALMINAPVSSELLASIFVTTTPLHDGAVIIRDGKILCAKAYYPSTSRTDLPLHFGTRHRAAIGISEQSDALTIVVSEETGYVSVTLNRQIDYHISRETLSLYFEKYLKFK